MQAISNSHRNQTSGLEAAVTKSLASGSAATTMAIITSATATTAAAPDAGTGVAAATAGAATATMTANKDYKGLRSKLGLSAASKLLQHSSRLAQLDVDIAAVDAELKEQAELLEMVRGVEGMEEEEAEVMQDQKESEVRLTGLKRSRVECVLQRDGAKARTEKYNA